MLKIIIDDLIVRLSFEIVQDCEGSPGSALLAGWCNACDMIEEGLIDPDDDARFSEAAFSAFDNMGYKLGDLADDLALGPNYVEYSPANFGGAE
ncbi:MAG: hypothetical protein KJN67_05060 [Pontiella sp.]|nr:hypothetical protein [Pontiella sp.]